jgi:CheY-like chemotaxis protein
MIVIANLDQTASNAATDGSDGGLNQGPPTPPASLSNAGASLSLDPDPLTLGSPADEDSGDQANPTGDGTSTANSDEGANPADDANNAGGGNPAGDPSYNSGMGPEQGGSASDQSDVGNATGTDAQPSAQNSKAGQVNAGSQPSSNDDQGQDGPGDLNAGGQQGADGTTNQAGASGLEDDGISSHSPAPSADNSGGEQGGGDHDLSGNTGPQNDAGNGGAPGRVDPAASQDGSSNGVSPSGGPIQVDSSGSADVTRNSSGELIGKKATPDHSSGHPDVSTMLAGQQAAGDAFWVWDANSASPTDPSATTMLCSGGGEAGARGPRHGTADGRLDPCYGSGPETQPALPTSHEAPAAVPEPAAKLGPGAIYIPGSASANLPGKPDDQGTHVLPAAAAPHRLGRLLKTPSETGQSPPFLTPRQADGGRMPILTDGPATYALLAESALAAPAEPTGPSLAPIVANSGQAGYSQGETDWSAWGRLTPLFLVAPYFPKRPQPTIMLAIADETARNDLNVALTNAGFVVFTAATARDALGVLRTPATPMDAAVVDVNLPDVSGLHLVGRLKELFPWLPVLVYADPADGVALVPLRDLGVQVLLKSSATSDMLAQVRALVL